MLRKGFYYVYIDNFWIKSGSRMVVIICFVKFWYFEINVDSDVGEYCDGYYGWKE